MDVIQPHSVSNSNEVLMGKAIRISVMEDSVIEHDGLPVQSVSKVPDSRIGGRYPIDFIGMPFRLSLPQLAVENFPEIKGQMFETAVSAVNARPGRCPVIAIVSPKEIPCLPASVTNPDRNECADSFPSG
jgi:hypothetical protein